MRLRRRDPESLGVLFDRYGKAAYDLAFRMMRDSGAAESVVAEAMLKCWNRIPRFRQTRRPAVGVWLLAITYLDALEHLGRTGSKALENAAIYQEWSQFLDADRVQEAHLGLQELTLEEKQSLELAFYEGFTPNELAARLGRSRIEVESLIQSVLAKLAPADHD